MGLAVHELRTPITVAAGYIRMVTREKVGPISDQQRKLLEEMGCDYMQGYLFGRPEPAAQVFAGTGRGMPGEFLRG